MLGMGTPAQSSLAGSKLKSQSKYSLSGLCPFLTSSTLQANRRWNNWPMSRWIRHPHRGNKVQLSRWRKNECSSATVSVNSFNVRVFNQWYCFALVLPHRSTSWHWTDWLRSEQRWELWWWKTSSPLLKAKWQIFPTLRKSQRVLLLHQRSDHEM